MKNCNEIPENTFEKMKLWDKLLRIIFFMFATFANLFMKFYCKFS